MRPACCAIASSSQPLCSTLYHPFSALLPHTVSSHCRAAILCSLVSSTTVTQPPSPLHYPTTQLPSLGSDMPSLHCFRIFSLPMLPHHSKKLSYHRCPLNCKVPCLITALPLWDQVTMLHGVIPYPIVDATPLRLPHYFRTTSTTLPPRYTTTS